MKVLLVALMIAACEHDSHDPPAIAPLPPPPAAPLACGDLTCTATEICTETTRAGGVAPPPGTERPPAIHYRCAPSLDPDCSTVDSRHQRCFEKIPSARPR